MKWSNEELVSIADEVIEELDSAISTLSGVRQYQEIKEALEQIKSDLIDESEPYKEAYYKECTEERAYENLEYERSRL